MSEQTTLRLIVGSVRPFEFYFYDSNSVAQPLVGATAATMDVKDSLDAVVKILEKTSAESPGLVIDLNSNKITCTLSQVEADALIPGNYVADLALQYPSGWQHTIPFDVEITQAGSEHL